MPILLDKINILLIVIAILNLLLGSMIFVKGSGKRANIIYSINILSLLGWIAGMFLYRSASQETGVFWCTVLYVAATLIPSIFLYFTYNFPVQEDKNVWKKGVLIFILNAAIIAATVIPGLIIKEVNIRPGLEKEIIFTQYYWFYFIYIFLLFNYSFYRLYRKLLTSRGVERQQILYVLIGVFLSAISAFVTNLVLPWAGYFVVNWLGQVSTIFMVIFTSYAILMYRLMDIRIVARKTFIYLGTGTFVYAAFYLIIWVYNKSFGGTFTNAALAFGLIAAPIFVLLFYRVDKGLKNFANKYLFVSLYNYQETINKLNDELTNHIELSKIIDLIVDTIKSTMQLDRAGVLLVNTSVTPTHYRIAKVIGFNENNGISLVQDNFLTQHLLQTQKPLVSDELVILARDSRNPEQNKSFLQLYENMKHIEASLCLPLISNNALIGIIVLGSKVSGDAYTKEDLEILSVLAKQAGIAIENAKLYKEVQDFNVTLKQKVDEQTKDIQEKALRLEKTLKVKSEFIYLMSHQLRTPISVITGMTSMLKDGDMDNLPAEKKQEFYEGIFVKSKKLADILNDFIKAESMDGEDFKFAPEDIKQSKFEDIVKTVCNDLKSQADEKKITLEYEPPTSPTSPIMTDPHYLEQAVTNLVDNAIKYTQKGSVKAKI